jgi:hypothetical protein
MYGVDKGREMKLSALCVRLCIAESCVYAAAIVVAAILTLLLKEAGSPVREAH